VITKVACVAAVLVAGLAAPAAAERQARDTVQTDHGAVRGVVAEDYRLFQGIPYAKPPVGELRWQPPQPVQRWRGTLDATAPRSQCAQLAVLGVPETHSEDCLYLNVTTPSRTRGKKPVMVWFHGGFFTSGSGAIYDGRRLAVTGDVVVVTVNFRLGPLGYLALPGLSAEHPGIQSGNYGIEDQQAALRWVRRNAAAFGGDPGNVTIFGESSGSASVCLHLTSPDSAGLFDRAIGESGSCATPQATKEAAESAGTNLAAQFGCTDPHTAAACMRSKPAGDLLHAWPGGGPAIGGREFPIQPPDALRQNRFRHVPLLLGNNRDEERFGTSLRYDATGHPVTPDQYQQIIASDYGPHADQVLRRYPLADYPTPSIALATIRTDKGGPLSTCDNLTGYQLAGRQTPVYAYQFADRTAPPLVDIPNFDEGAEHGTELNYVFPNVFGRPLTQQQQALADTMVRYWTNFAHTGNPNGRKTPYWPRFRDATDVLALDLGPDGIEPTDIASASNCAFWASLT
jgi:para-nitrobenzyl esterase